MVQNKRVYIPIRGAGNAGAGSSQAGYGEPTDINFVNQDFIIAQGPATGLIGNSPFINASTRDYAMDAYGTYIGADIIQQMVYLAIATARGSTGSSLGVDYANSQVISANIQAVVTNDVNNALNDLIKRKLIALNGVVVNDLGNSLQIKINWTNISSGVNYWTTL